MIGERIGHLRVIASIGVGGMGAVWHAVDELLDRHVALKVIRPELMSRPGLAERFRSEAIVLARLQHPCIAALYGLEKRGDEFVMVMEFVDGETLDNRVAVQGALPWPEATRITRAVLDALDHAHESGVIHRDIKPANVMITRAGRVKVMDFGIARLVGAQRQTRTGAAVGTPSYMSPEQLLGQEVDGRADVYAVGTLLYELTTGHLPFEVEGDYLRMIAQLQQIPAAPSTHQPDLPTGLDLIVARALRKEPEDRYATAGDFRDALEELERAHGVLRPYGTPATGNSPVPGSTTTRGTPVSIPAVQPKPTPSFNLNSSALLTPVESAMSLTPVPFTVGPASATPVDLTARASIASAAGAPAPQGLTPAAPEPTPEFSSVVAAASDPMIVVAKKGGMPKAAVAIGAIAVVAIGGILASQKLTQTERAGALPDSTVAAPPVVIAEAPVSIAPTVVAPVTIDSVVDSAALKKLADSVKAVRRARQDSIRAVRDSIAKLVVGSDPFALPGSSAAPLTREQRREGEDTGRAAIRECVALLSGQNVRTLRERFGSDFPKSILRIATDNNLAVGAPLGITFDLDDLVGGSIVTKAGVLLGLKNDPTAALPYRAELRAVSQKDGATWRPARCFVDRDGGFKS
jgi:serine/threonine-protein kinase